MACVCKNKKHGIFGCVIEITSTDDDGNTTHPKTLCNWCFAGCYKRGEAL